MTDEGPVKLDVYCSAKCGYTGRRNRGTAMKRPCPRCGERVAFYTQTSSGKGLVNVGVCTYKIVENDQGGGWWTGPTEYPGRSSGERRRMTDELSLESWARERARGVGTIIVSEHLWRRLQLILCEKAGSTNEALVKAKGQLQAAS